MTKLALVSLAIASGNAFAEADVNDPLREGDTNNALPTVEVTGQTESTVKRRSDVSVDNKALPSAVTTISHDDLETLNVGRDMSNVFRRVPGVVANNIDQGDTGNGFRMRGFATQGTHGADTAVYVDGVPQNIPSSQGGAGHGPVFLEWLTPDMIERIDVIKGPISALYGDQNRAGAVDIRTRTGGHDQPSSIGVTAESYNGRRLSLALSGEYNDIKSYFVGDLYQSDSFRARAHNRRNNLFWKLSKKVGDGIYSVRASHYESDFTAAGYLLLPSLQAGLDPKSVQYNLPGFGNAERTSLVFNRVPAASEEGWYATAYAEDFKRTRAITTSTTQHTVGKDDRRIFGGRLAQNLSLTEKSAVIFGADMRYDEGDAFRQQYQYNLPTSNYINNQGLQLLTVGLFAQGQYKIVPSLKVTGGLRYDRFDYSIDNRKLPAASTDYTGSVFTPKYGAVWTVSPAFELFANVAQGFRSPAAEQISSSGSLGPLNGTGGVISNSIKPTKVKSYDTGFTSTPGNNWTLGGAVYYTLNEDEIVNTAPDVYQSVGDTTRKGFELETRYQFNDAASVYLNYGRIITARINNPTPGTGAMLSVPRHTYKAGGQYKTPMGPGKLTTNIDVYVTDGNPFYSGTPSTSKDMPVYTRYDLKATYDYRQWQASLFYILQPHEFGSDIAYGTTAGLLLSPMPKHQFGATLRYFF